MNGRELLVVTLDTDGILQQLLKKVVKYVVLMVELAVALLTICIVI